MEITSTLSVKHKMYLICLMLVVSTAFAYWKIDKCAFVDFDDQDYIVRNTYLDEGFTAKNIHWAFTSLSLANWHPVTWLSHTLDCKLYGKKPAGHHLTSLLFHIFNTLLLFFALKSLTGTLWRSALVAALFGLHPLHVESVAWVSERKDVLSAFFMFFTLLCYSHYARHKKKILYGAALVCFVLGIMSKPMLVTLPFVLLLLDFWPLKRIDFFEKGKRKDIGMLIIEKVPFFLLAAISCVITVIAQKGGEAIVDTVQLPLKIRLTNALLSYAGYMAKMFWPMDLSFYYRHPVCVPPLWLLARTIALLLAITVVSVVLIKKRPYIATGWFWFIGTLIPVIGIVQVGAQAMADRYTYIPLIGLFIVVVWLLYGLSMIKRWLKITICSMCIVILVLLMFQTRTQAGYWKDDITLADHAIALSDQNFMAYSVKANRLFLLNRYDEALYNYKIALSQCPKMIMTKVNIGSIYINQKKLPEAAEIYKEVLTKDPDNLLANLNAGKTFAGMGNYKAAIQCLSHAIMLDTNFYAALFNLGSVYGQMKDYTKCRYYLLKAVQANTQNPDVYIALGECCKCEGKTEEAIQWYQKSLAINDFNPYAYRQLAYLYGLTKDKILAAGSSQKADSLEAIIRENVKK